MEIPKSVQIHKIEQEIIAESLRYQNVSRNREEEELRIDSLRRIIALQKKLQELKASLKT